MQKIKLFPAPHVEVRIHVSDGMAADLRECRRMLEQTGNGKDCNQCSWADVIWMDTGFCELPAVREKILEEKQDGENRTDRNEQSGRGDDGACL